MDVLLPLSHLINYLLFAFLAGHIALKFVPKEKKPKTAVPKPALLLSALGIMICTFMPVLEVIRYFADNSGFTSVLLSVITDFQVGRAFLATGFSGALLWLTIQLRGSKYLEAFWLLIMIAAQGYASHVASLSFWTGFASHSVHFFMISLWGGILLHISFFVKGENNWQAFLRWFTPFAILSLVLIFSSGLVLMFKIVEPREYFMSWALPYGQMLLLKHISIIPVLAFAFINGFLAKKAEREKTFNPVPWVKAETILLLAVFSFTAIMGTLSPPHDPDITVTTEGASKWASFLIGKEIAAPISVHLNMSYQGVFLFLISFLFLAMIMESFRKKTSALLGLLFGLCFIASLYFGIMLDITL
ncbi:CopD family protein [Bacillus sp. MUM 13]|uniref:copper resistance D family protein n=1 Tax=Bacillus sp. MUM 13 TaxID=1678001 RepID=UPI0008F5C688|nr:CopD family protein [Bacillus sp. MUM 13]OIK11839.1 hypothetical protein BIV59_10920 [Bacillus sp. MUM 13]